MKDVSKAVGLVACKVVVLKAFIQHRHSSPIDTMEALDKIADDLLSIRREIRNEEIGTDRPSRKQSRRA